MENYPDEQNNMQSSAAAAADNGTSFDEDDETVDKEYSTSFSPGYRFAPTDDEEYSTSFPPGYRFAPADDEEFSTSFPPGPTEDEEYLTSFPPGYRFAPTDDELMEDYLIKKINNEPLPPNQIPEVDFYSKDPTQLVVEYKPITETEWYFFTPRVKKYPNGSRPKRGTPSGYWKPTGIDKAIPRDSQHPIGYKKTLDFFTGEYPKGNKTNWKMHEYKVVKDDKNSHNKARNKDDMMLDKWVLCRIYKKRGKNGGDEVSNGGNQTPTVNVAQNKEASLMVENDNIGFKDQNSIVSQPVPPNNEASLMAGNNNVGSEDRTWNASQPTFYVPQNNEVSLMAENKNIGCEDQPWNATQPTFNIPQNKEVSSMTGSNNIGYEYQTWNSFQPTFNVPQNNEVSSMVGNNNIGYEYQTWNASQPTSNVPLHNNNIGYEDQTWNASQPTFNVLQTNEASSMPENNNISYEDQTWIAYQLAVNVLQNNEASSLMARNNNIMFEYQNSYPSQSTPNQGPMHEEPRTSQTCFTISPDESDFWDDDIDHAAFDGQSSAKGI